MVVVNSLVIKERNRKHSKKGKTEMKLSFKKSFMFVLTLLALTFSALGSATAVYAAPVPLTESTQTVEAPSLLQFTSSVHILGFTSNGMYAATCSHALHVDFVNANSLQRGGT